MLLHFFASSHLLSFPAQFPNKQIIAGPLGARSGDGAARREARTSESVSDKTRSVRPFVYLISNPICFRSQATSTSGLKKHASSPQWRRWRPTTACGSAPLAPAKATTDMRKAPNGVCLHGAPLREFGSGNTWRSSQRLLPGRRSRDRRSLDLMHARY